MTYKVHNFKNFKSFRLTNFAINIRLMTPIIPLASYFNNGISVRMYIAVRNSCCDMLSVHLSC